jgi:hypothetical protein
MTDRTGPNEPNAEGFAGDPSTPEPRRDTEEDRTEQIAVPSDDLTHPVASAMDPEPTD